MTIMTKEEVGAWCKEIADQINSGPILLDVFTRAYCTEEEEHMSTRECKKHPDAPHGFLRNASHNAGRYVCECEHWEENT
jgi:hypothetical protein